MKTLINRLFQTSLLIKILTISLIIILIGAFFSYRLLQTPSGLTIDELAFGYNATLLANTGHDQNGRLLPIFVFSLGQDWRQPITQYFLTALFKVAGPSVFLLRFSSVIITLISLGLVYFLSSKILSPKTALWTALTFITTPIIMIQTHLALDNIMVIPFTIAWLLWLYLFSQHHQTRFLILAGAVLGISFYSYKGMRATVPIWAVLSVFYLFWDFFRQPTQNAFKKSLQTSLIFAVSIAPFLAIIPWLESKYPGAIFDNQKASFDSVYSFLYPYLSSFDLGFLYIRGDELIYHSTLKHGMMLLVTLPLFIIGIYQAIKKGNFWWLILLCFFTAPLLYGYVGSIHRASRLLSMVPSYCLITTLGIDYIYHQLKSQKFKILALTLATLAILNYGDFLNYYWYQYPQDSRFAFGDLTTYQDYQLLHQTALANHLTPMVSLEIARKGKVDDNFYQSIYFGKPLPVLATDFAPANSLIISLSDKIPNFQTFKIQPQHYHFLIPD